MSSDSIRSEAQREASRINGSASHGPITEEGKIRSSQNGIKHGLRSPRVVLCNESREDYESLLASYIREFAPTGITESELVVRMVNALWRIQRIDRMRDGA